MTKEELQELTDACVKIANSSVINTFGLSNKFVVVHITAKVAETLLNKALSENIHARNSRTIQNALLDTPLGHKR